MDKNILDVSGKRLTGIAASMLAIIAMLVLIHIRGGMNTDSVILVILLNVIGHVVLFFMHAKSETVRRKVVLVALFINVLTVSYGIMLSFWMESDGLEQYVLKESQCISREEWDAGDYSEREGLIPVVELKNAAAGIVLTWDEVTEAEGYGIFRKDGEEEEFHLILMLMDPSVTTYTDISALSAVEYDYAVCAFSGKKLSDCVISEITSAIWRPVIQAEAINEGIHISWNYIVGVDGYHIYRKEADGKYSQIASVANGEVLEYIDTDAVFGTEYTYGIRAYIGEDVSGLATKKITAVLEEPVVQVSVVDSGVQVGWQYVDMAEGYIVYRKLDGENFKTIIIIEDPAVTTYLDTEPISGESNLYTVRAYRGKYKSAYTGVDIQVPAAVGVAAEPVLADLERTEVEITGSRSRVNLSWNIVENAEGYRIYRKEEGEDGYMLLATIEDPSVDSYRDEDISRGNTYLYYVRAYVGDQESSYSGGKIDIP